MQFRTFEELVNNVEKHQVLKVSNDGGITWHYVKVRKTYAVTYALGAGEGLMADGAIREQYPKTHYVAPILRKKFKEPGFIVETTTSEEIAGIKFSYDNLYKDQNI